MKRLQSWSPARQNVLVEHGRGTLESATAAPAYEPENVRRDLLYLRKSAGYSGKRLARCLALRQVLGGLDVPEAILRERLLSAMQSLRDPDADVLLAVYALGEEDTSGERTLQQRRDAYGRRHGVLREAVADRDTKAIDRLLVQLITGWYPKSPLPLRVPDSHNAVVITRIHTRTVVENRRHIETRRWIQFLATFDGAEYVAIASPSAGLAYSGDAVRVEVLPVESGYLQKFWFPEPLRRGRLYTLEAHIQGDPEDEYWLTEESMAFHEPTRTATFEIAFQRKQPLSIWQFNGLSEIERPGRPSTQQLLRLDDNGAVGATFHDQHGGLYAGIAWKW